MTRKTLAVLVTGFVAGIIMLGSQLALPQVVEASHPVRRDCVIRCRVQLKKCLAAPSVGSPKRCLAAYEQCLKACAPGY